jgi:hypothetical protein
MRTTDLDPAPMPTWLQPLAWGAALALILLPLLAMRLADKNAWALSDLPFALIMVAAVGLAFEFAVRIPARWTHRAGAAMALGVAVLLIWGNLAVGFAGSEDNAINVIFFSVPVIALVGSAVARFRPAGIAIALVAAAMAQIATGAIAFHYGFFTGPLTFSFTGLWLAAALLFRRSAHAV